MIENPEELKGLFKQASAMYAETKKVCAKLVVSKEWFSADAFSVMPYYFERNEIESGRRLVAKPEAGKFASPVLYGKDAAGQITTYEVYDRQMKPKAHGCISREGITATSIRKIPSGYIVAKVEGMRDGLPQSWAQVTKEWGAIARLEDRGSEILIEEQKFDFRANTTSSFRDTIQRDKDGRTSRILRTFGDDTRTLWEARAADRTDADDVISASRSFSDWLAANRKAIADSAGGSIKAVLIAQQEKGALLHAIGPRDFDAHAANATSLEELLNPAELEVEEIELPDVPFANASARREALVAFARYLMSDGRSILGAGADLIVSVSDLEMSELESNLAAIYGKKYPPELEALRKPKAGKKRPRSKS